MLLVWYSWGGAASGGAVQGSCQLPGLELLALPPPKTWLIVTMARAFTSPLTGLCVKTMQSLAEVVGVGLLGAAMAGAGQEVCVLLGVQLLTPPPTKTWQTVTMTRAGSSLLTRLCVTMLQSLKVVGTEFPLSAAAVGAGQGGCLQLGAGLGTPPSMKTWHHQLRMKEKISTSSQGLEDSNDLGSSGDGAALRCLGEAALGSSATNVDQDEEDILKSICLGSHNVHLLTHFAMCHFAEDWRAYLLFACWVD
jgi:hypothetical protein